MINAHEWLAAEVTTWGPGIADHLWQSTLFALIILSASAALRRGPASLRHSLWLLASAKFLVPTGLVILLMQQAGLDPSWFFQPTSGSMNLLQGITEPVTSLAFSITVMASATGRHSEVYCALALIWLTGTLSFFGVWALRRRRVSDALQQGRTADSGREWQALERAKKSLPRHPQIKLVISSDKTDPAVCGIWKPVVLLPKAIADHLDDEELEAIMLHELIHIQRRDNLIGNLQMTISALLWFHPLVWFIGNKLFDERELACDEEVLKRRSAPEAYASSILKVVRFSLGWRVAGVTGAGSGSNLRRRIENIMNTNNTDRSAKAWDRLLAGMLVGLAVVVALVAGVYTRAGDVNAAVNTQQVTNTASLAEIDGPGAQLTAADDQTKKAKEAVPSPPAQPAQPAQPAPPGQPSQPAGLSQPAPPARPSDPAGAPTSPAAPSATTAVTPVAPAAPAAPALPASPAEPVKEKTKSKDKVKQKDDKVKVDKGGLIEAPQPVYPEEARAQRIEGEVTVAIVVGEDGNVVSAKPTSGHQLLQGAAKDAAFKARFRPSSMEGKPVKVSGILSYNFLLDKK